MKKILFIGLLILIVSCQSANLTPPNESTPQPNAEEAPVPTFTPAPTLPPSPTATAISPTPVPLFFTEEFNHNLDVWAFFHTGGEQEPIANLQLDSLMLQMESPHTWVYAIHNAHEYESVFISTKFSGAPSGALGLVCNYTEENGWYEFNVTHEGTYSVLYGQWLADGIAEYRPIFNGASEYLKPGTLDYAIGLACTENLMFFYINEKLFRKLDVAHIGLTKGKVGITAASFDNIPMNANFEWFKVSQPEQ